MVPTPVKINGIYTLKGSIRVYLAKEETLEDEVEDRLRAGGGYDGASETVTGSGGTTLSGIFPVVTSCRLLLWEEASLEAGGAVVIPSDNSCSWRIASLRSFPLLVEATFSLSGVGISNPGGVCI